jgi:hypothetical protein
MAICGKVEVKISGENSSVFVGIGSLGWRRRFSWNEVDSIREEGSKMSYPGSHSGGIVMEGKTRLKFGQGLSESRRYFVFNALKWLKQNGQGFYLR